MPFQYVPRDASKWDRRANQSGSNYANVIKDEFNTFGPKDGENTIRICPPTWDFSVHGNEHYGYDIWVHFNVGPEGGTVLCLSRMKHQACPICEAQAKYETIGREDAKDFKPKRRVGIWLIDRKAEKPEDNPAIWTMGWTVDRDISLVCKDRETGQLYMIDHPTSGYDVYFNKTGKGDQTKYTGYAIGRRETIVEQKHLDFIAANPIPSTLIWRDYKEIQDLFEGEAPPKAEEGLPVAAPTNGVSSFTPPPVVQVPVQTVIPVAPPAPPVTVITPPAPPPPPKAFVSDWVFDDTNSVIPCQTCGKPLYTISPTEATCEAAHRVVIATLFTAPAPPAPPVAAVPSQPPAATKIEERAGAMRSRFQTGQK